MEQVPEISKLMWNFSENHYVKDTGVNNEVLLPATPLESLGNRDFCRDLGLRLPLIAGAMANGIASEDLVESLAAENLLGVFGAAGLSINRIREAVQRLKANLASKPFGVNLIHNPSEPHWEWDLVKLLVEEDIQIVEASAFMKLTLPLVYYRVKGIHRDDNGQIVAPNKIIAKASRVEIAEKFFSPPPEAMLRSLYEDGYISAAEANLAQEIPVAQYLTAEADSGGHTDNRPALTMFPIMKALKDRLQNLYDYEAKLCLGMAGGISTPSSAASAFSMGAAYIMLGSVMQSCVESGTSKKVKQTLSQVSQADVLMAPAADMFEMGVQVQVLKKGTMFPMRAKKLFEIYKTYASIEDIPAADRATLEGQIFRKSLDDVWKETKEFFQERDPDKLEYCEDNPKLKMALVFRWYLGLASKWANEGMDGREMDYQVWCGSAMGAFNEWAKGSFLEKPEERRAPLVAMNLFLGAFALQRIGILKAQGLSTQQWEYLAEQPMTRDEISKILREG